MKNNRILPVGLKGNQINERMMELMGINQINENKSAIAVELTKMGPDGKAYAIIRENHEYYIKSTDKTSGLVAEDFKYIGGLQNKKQEAYPSYAKAIKHLNLKFNSIQEALDTRIDINVFEDDNLLKEDIAGFSNAYGGGFSGAGNLEGNSSLYEEEEVDGEEEEEGTLMSEVDEDMTDEEKAIDEMLDESWMEEELTGNQHKIDMNHNDEIDAQDFKIMRGMDEELTGNQHKIDMNHNNKIDGEDLSMLRGMDEDMYEEENIGGNPNDELFDRLDNMTGEELVQFLKDAGQDVKNKFMSMISAGADRARNYLDKRYPENESLYEGKLSINRAIDKMDSIIDSLTETDVKKKA